MAIISAPLVAPLAPLASGRVVRFRPRVSRAVAAGRCMRARGSVVLAARELPDWLEENPKEPSAVRKPSLEETRLLLQQQIEERRKLHDALLARVAAGQVEDGFSAAQTRAAAVTAPARAAPPAPAAARAPAAAPSRAAPPAPTSPQSVAVIDPPAAAPLCKERLNVVMVAMECAPWAKTGGLGDVASSLPKALARRGHRVMCVTPRYKNYPGVSDTKVRIRLRCCGHESEVGFFHTYQDGVDFVFVDNPAFHHYQDKIYGGNSDELLFRCSILCQAALESVWNVPCGGAMYGDENLVFLANDWHTALLPVYLQAYYRDHNKMTYARSMLVIHNLAHQGRSSMDAFNKLGLPEQYREWFQLDDPVGGVGMNIFKAGLIAAQRLVAVSTGYAWECQTDLGGWGLAPTMQSLSWKLKGVVNGIDLDEWSPDVDVHLTTDGYQQYKPGAEGLAGKAACKLALQRELGLPERADVPIVCFIGRLDHQKGVDLIAESTGWLMSQDLQLILLGSGAADLESSLRGMESHNREKVRAWIGFSVKMAHRMTAGCDILLMPSRFEPCGLNQLYAMRYGSIPVVHAVGGLRDTVQAFNPYENTGTGWTFPSATSHELVGAMGNALYTYRTHRDAFTGLQLRGMAQDMAWDKAAAEYEDQLLAAKYQW